MPFRRRRSSLAVGHVMLVRTHTHIQKRGNASFLAPLPPAAAAVDKFPSSPWTGSERENMMEHKTWLKMRGDRTKNGIIHPTIIKRAAAISSCMARETQKARKGTNGEGFSCFLCGFRRHQRLLIARQKHITNASAAALSALLLLPQSVVVKISYYSASFLSSSLTFCCCL